MNDQTLPDPPVTLGSHEQFVERFEEYLGAVYPPSGGMRRDTGRQEFARSLTSQMQDRSAVRVLDCAAGTGFPSLDLARVAPDTFRIHCCDGDKKMIAILETQAEKIGIELQAMVPPRSTTETSGGQLSPLVANWAELDALEDQYDYVLCRGNALAYADTWDGNEEVASDKTLRVYLEAMIRRVRPGGFLHVDAPKTTELDRIISRTLGTEKESIEEKVTIDSGRRRWIVTFRHGDEKPISFVRFSSLLTIDSLQAILDDYGLEHTKPFDLADERPNFGVIIARRPA